MLALSARTGEGFDALAARVEELFLDGALDLRTDAVVTSARQYAALLQASESLALTADALTAGLELDLCCVSVERAMEALGEIDGRAVLDDVVHEIFSHFCVGK